MAILNRNTLADAASWVAGFVPSRPATPILAGMRLSYRNQHLVVEAFDYEIAAGAAVATDNDGEPDWTVVVPGALFAQIVKGGTSKEIALAPGDAGLHWEMGRAKGILHVLAGEEFPLLPDRALAEHVVTVDRATLQARVQSASSLCMDGEWRNGVLLEVNKDGFWVKAGNNYALQRSKVAAGISKLATFLLPHKTLSLGLKMPGETLEIMADRDRVWLVAGDDGDRRAVAMPTLTSQFPVIDALFTASRPVSATVEGSELVESLKAVALVTNSVTLVATEGSLALSARKPYGGGELMSDVEAEVTATESEGEVTASMQIPYLLAAVKGNAGEVQLFAMATGSNPSWLIQEGNTETVIMPLRGV